MKPSDDSNAVAQHSTDNTDILRAITRVCKWIDLFVAPFVGMCKIPYQK